MSFVFNGTNGLAVTGLNIDAALFSNSGIFVGAFVLRTQTSGWHFLADLCAVNSGNYPHTQIRLEGSGEIVDIEFRNVGQGGKRSFVGGVIPQDVWTLAGGYIADPSGGSAAMACVDDDNITVDGEAFPSSYPGANLTRFFVGMRRTDDDSGPEYTTQCKIAVPYILKRPPTQGEIDSIKAGNHPAVVFGAALLDDWPKNSKTSRINGWVLTDQGTGAVTIDTGDNPPIGDPPAGGKLLLQLAHRLR